MKRLRTLSCVLLVIVCGTVAARGEIVSFEFAGRVSRIFNPAGAYEFPVEVGDAAWAYVVYESVSPDLLPEDPSEGLYFAKGHFDFVVNSMVFEKEGRIRVDVAHDSQGRELFGVTGRDAGTQWVTFVPEGFATEMSMSFWQAAPPFSLLENDVLPTAVDFFRATGSEAVARMFSPAGELVFAVEFQLAPVPEPATWALLGLGLACVCWRARRR